MPDRPRAIYWDACVFLSYLNGIADRAPVLESLLAESAKNGGDVKLYTSAVSLTEVAFAASEKQGTALDEAVEKQIDNLWNDPRAVNIIEYHSVIAMEAQGLIRQSVSRGWSLKPLDAIHLATAQWLSKLGIALEAFHTYDRSLLRYDPMVGYSIMEPAIPNPRLL